MNFSVVGGFALSSLQFSFTEVVEHACGLATLQMGEFVSNVSNGIDTYSIREPLGVCAGICPFDFPALIPLWVSLLIFHFDFYNSFRLSSILDSKMFSLCVTRWLGIPFSVLLMSLK